MEARFDKALSLPWPPAIHAELAEQRAQLERAGETLLLLQYGVQRDDRNADGAPSTAS